MSYTRIKAAFSSVKESPSNNFWFLPKSSGGVHCKVCTASLYRMTEAEKRTVRVFAAFRKELEGTDAFNHYTDWLVERSFCKTGLRAKKGATLRNIGSLVNTKADVYIAHQALMALRRGYENPQSIFVFHELTKHGLPENLAYFMCEAFKGTVEKLELIDNREYHGRILPAAGVSISSLMKGQPRGLTGRPWGDAGVSYSGVYDAYRGRFFLSTLQLSSLRKRAKDEYLKRKTVATVGYINPFKKAAEERKTYPSLQDWCVAVRKELEQDSRVAKYLKPIN